jgi:DNA-binding GntR family transcriptional regulator
LINDLVFKACLNYALRVPTVNGGHATISGRAFASIKESILSGTLAPGARLHIGDLARELEMSAMPVREAVGQLVALGLAEQVPHRGARVRELSLEDLADVYLARLPLETLAVTLAVERWSETTAQRAAAGLNRTVEAERSQDFAASWAADGAFHFALYEAAGSEWLLRLITPLWESSERYRRLSRSSGRDFGERYREHMSILDACIRREPDLAATRLRDHLCRSANLLARSLGGAQLFAEKESRRLAVALPAR